MLGILTYDSNNSGGEWWLGDKDWYALERAGWNVAWVGLTSRVQYQRFLGALATSAAKTFSSPEEGVKEWEKITHQNAKAAGCLCCGKPHSFTFDYEDGRTIYLYDGGWEDD